MSRELPSPCPEDEYTFRGGLVGGKLDIAALLEEHLMPDGFDPDDIQALENLEQLFDNARAQSEPLLGAQVRPCRDPTTDHLLAALNVLEVSRPRSFTLLLDGLLLISGLLFAATLALNAATAWALLTHGSLGTGLACLVLLLAQYPTTAALLAVQLRGHHWASAWFAVPAYDAACLFVLPYLQRTSLADRKRLCRQRPWLQDAEQWLWQYRCMRHLLAAVLLSLPAAIVDVAAAAEHATGSPLPPSGLGLVVAAAVVSALHAVQALAEAAVNARWSGQMSWCSYVGLALQLRGSRKLPLEWQSSLSDVKLVIKPDAPDFCELTRPQQCQVLRLALQRPHFAVSNVVTHPRPPPKGAPGISASAAAAAAAGTGAESGTDVEAQQGAGCGLGCGAVSQAAAAAGAKCIELPGCSALAARWAQRQRRRHRGSSDDSDDGRPAPPPSACLLLQSKAAVKTAVGLLPGPLAAARHTLANTEFLVNLVSFSDAASCKHCVKLLELVVRQGLRALVICDAKLPADFFGVLSSYLPSRTCRLQRLVLKDVLSSGIGTLCMLCDALAANSSVTHLDLSNNQLWGMRGARALRGALRTAGGLKVLLLPYCNIASPGAIEILKGAVESRTLEQIDLSQNRIGDDVPCWADATPCNRAMREVDMSFNWIQDSLAAWAAALLEGFPTLTRLHLNHNSDAAASRVASRAVTPRYMTPRSLTPRTLTPSHLRVASYSQVPPSLTPSTAPTPPTSDKLEAVASPAQDKAVSPPPQGPHPSSATGFAHATSSALGAATGSGPAPTSGGLTGGGMPWSHSRPVQGVSGAGGLRHQHVSGASAHDWAGAAHHSAAGAAGGAEAHAPGAGPSRSRGQQIIAHLELYILRAVHGSHGTSTGLAVPPGGGGSGSGGTGPLDMLTGERTSPSDLPTLSGRGGGGGGGGLPSTSGMHNRPASGASSTQYGLATRSRPVSASVAAAAAAALAGAAPSGGRAHPAACRTPGSLISAVCGMELLDLRGIPFPSWWARGQLYRPPCVMVDNAQVYDEPPAGAAAGAGGGRGGMELPPHVARTLEAGLSQGLVVLDLNAPEYKHLSRCQQLAAIYVAFAHATHITISNTPIRAGSALSGGPPGMAGLLTGTNIGAIRSSSSFAHAHSGAMAYGTPVPGGLAAAMTAAPGLAGWRYDSETGIVPGSPRGGGAAAASGGHAAPCGPGGVHGTYRPHLSASLRYAAGSLSMPSNARTRSSRSGGTTPAAGAIAVPHVPSVPTLPGATSNSPPELSTVSLQSSAAAAAAVAVAALVHPAAADGSNGGPMMAAAARGGLQAARRAPSAAAGGSDSLHRLAVHRSSASHTVGSGSLTVAAAAAPTSAGSPGGGSVRSLPTAAQASNAAGRESAVRGQPAAEAAVKAGTAASAVTGCCTSNLSPEGSNASTDRERLVKQQATPRQAARTVSSTLNPDVLYVFRRGLSGTASEGVEEDSRATEEGDAESGNARVVATAAVLGSVGGVTAVRQVVSDRGGGGGEPHGPPRPSRAGGASGAASRDNALAPVHVMHNMGPPAEGTDDMELVPPSGATLASSPPDLSSVPPSVGASTLATPARQLSAVDGGGIEHPSGSKGRLPPPPPPVSLSLAAAAACKARQAARLGSPGSATKGADSAEPSPAAPRTHTLPGDAAPTSAERPAPTSSLLSTVGMEGSLLAAGIAALTHAAAADTTAPAGPAAPAAPTLTVAMVVPGPDSNGSGTLTPSSAQPANPTSGSSHCADAPGNSFSFSPMLPSALPPQQHPQHPPQLQQQAPCAMSPDPTAERRAYGLEDSAHVPPHAPATAAAAAAAAARLAIHTRGLGPCRPASLRSAPPGRLGSIREPRVSGDGDEGTELEVSLRTEDRMNSGLEPAAAAAAAGAEGRAVFGGRRVPGMSGGGGNVAAAGAPEGAALADGIRFRSDNGDAQRALVQQQQHQQQLGVRQVSVGGIASPLAHARPAHHRTGLLPASQSLRRNAGPTSAPAPAFLARPASAMAGPHVSATPLAEGARRASNRRASLNSQSQQGSYLLYGNPTPGHPLVAHGAPRLHHAVSRPASAQGPASSAQHLQYGRARSAFVGGQGHGQLHAPQQVYDSAAVVAMGLASNTGIASAAAAGGGPDVLDSFDQDLVSPGLAMALHEAGGMGGGPGGGGGLRGLAAGVEATNAVAVVVVVGQEGQLRVPLRCLELPLKGALARREGTTVSFRVSGLSHEGMRQLRALMAVAKVPVPDRSYAWLLPSHSNVGHAMSVTGSLPPTPSLHALQAAAAASRQHALQRNANGLFSLGSGAVSVGGPGPGSTATGGLMSRADTGALEVGGVTSPFYFDAKGQPVDLGYILPPMDSCDNPSGYFASAAYLPMLNNAGSGAGGGAAGSAYGAAAGGGLGPAMRFHRAGSLGTARPELDAQLASMGSYRGPGGPMGHFGQDRPMGLSGQPQLAAGHVLMSQLQQEPSDKQTQLLQQAAAWAGVGPAAAAAAAQSVSRTITPSSEQLTAGGSLASASTSRLPRQGSSSKEPCPHPNQQQQQLFRQRTGSESIGTMGSGRLGAFPLVRSPSASIGRRHPRPVQLPAAVAEEPLGSPTLGRPPVAAPGATAFEPVGAPSPEAALAAAAALVCLRDGSSGSNVLPSPFMTPRLQTGPASASPEAVDASTRNAAPPPGTKRKLKGVGQLQQQQRPSSTPQAAALEDLDPGESFTGTLERTSASSLPPSHTRTPMHMLHSPPFAHAHTGLSGSAATGGTHAGTAGSSAPGVLQPAVAANSNNDSTGTAGTPRSSVRAFAAAGNASGSTGSTTPGGSPLHAFITAAGPMDAVSGENLAAAERCLMAAYAAGSLGTVDRGLLQYNAFGSQFDVAPSSGHTAAAAAASALLAASLASGGDMAAAAAALAGDGSSGVAYWTGPGSGEPSGVQTLGLAGLAGRRVGGGSGSGGQSPTVASGQMLQQLPALVALLAERKRHSGSNLAGVGGVQGRPVAHRTRAGSSCGSLMEGEASGGMAAADGSGSGGPGRVVAHVGGGAAGGAVPYGAAVGGPMARISESQPYPRVALREHVSGVGSEAEGEWSSGRIASGAGAGSGAGTGGGSGSGAGGGSSAGGDGGSSGLKRLPRSSAVAVAGVGPMGLGSMGATTSCAGVAQGSNGAGSGLLMEMEAVDAQQPLGVGDGGGKERSSR